LKKNGEPGMRLAREVAGFCQAHSLLERGDWVLAAVSGGPDSAVLLDLLCLFGKDLDLAIGVAHLNHGLRGGESDQDQQFVRLLARERGLPFFTKKTDIARKARRDRSSLETAAREARKEFLEATARRHGFGKIATGHTLGDQAETVLMHLIRGVGGDGLCGIPVKNGRFIRPLLETGREQVMAHLQARGLKFRTDSSNARADVFRNRVRLELMPLLRRYNPRIEEALARTAETLAGDRESLTVTADEAAARSVRAGEKALSIDLQAFKGYNKGLRRSILRLCCARLLGPGRTPDFRSSERALALAESGRVGQSTPLAGGLWAWLGYGCLHIGRKASRGQEKAEGRKALKVPGSVKWGGWVVVCSLLDRGPASPASSDKNAALFDFGGLGRRKLYVGPSRPGLRMRPFGSGGTRKVQDIMVDCKIPRQERPSWPVIYAGQQPIWLAGIRRSDAAPLTGKTRKVIRLEIKRA
jgi:tRNA(Ile)-lysidine synthase